MNNFKKSIKVEENEKKYEIRDIYIKVNNNTGKCIAYFREGIEQIGDYEFRRFLTNIEDERDIISYTELGFPGGPYRKTSGQGDEFSLYNFKSMYYVLLGEEPIPYMMITKHQIDELISQYESQRQSMKYYELEEVRCKGKVAYIGRYLESGDAMEKELFGNVFFESGCGWKGVDNGSRRILANNRCLKEFNDQKNLNFTESALQNIVERNREKEK